MSRSNDRTLTAVNRLLLTLLVFLLYGAFWLADFAYHDNAAKRALDNAGYGERGYKESPPWRCPLGRGIDFGGNRGDFEIQGYVCTYLFGPSKIHELPFSDDWKAGLGD
jgi:hypothetical protein